MNAEQIVRRLAMVDPAVLLDDDFDEWACGMCEGDRVTFDQALGDVPLVHEDTCVWLAAREWVKAEDDAAELVSRALGRTSTPQVTERTVPEMAVLVDGERVPIPRPPDGAATTWYVHSNRGHPFIADGPIECIAVIRLAPHVCAVRNGDITPWRTT